MNFFLNEAEERAHELIRINKTANRSCLSCRKVFLSKSYGNRLCSNCSHRKKISDKWADTAPL